MRIFPTETFLSEIVNIFTNNRLSIIGVSHIFLEIDEGKREIRANSRCSLFICLCKCYKFALSRMEEQFHRPDCAREHGK